MNLFYYLKSSVMLLSQPKNKKNNLQVKIFDNHADYSRAIFTKKAFQNTTSLTASAIINDSHSQDSDRFYLYQKNQN